MPIKKYVNINLFYEDVEELFKLFPILVDSLDNTLNQIPLYDKSVIKKILIVKSLCLKFRNQLEIVMVNYNDKERN